MIPLHEILYLPFADRCREMALHFSLATHTGAADPKILEVALYLYQKALVLYQRDGQTEHLGEVYFGIATLFKARFSRDCIPSDLDESVLGFLNALEYQPPPHVDRGMTLKFLGNSFMTMHRLHPNVLHLDEAINYTLEASYLHLKDINFQADVRRELGECFSQRYQLTGDTQDLSNAVAVLRNIVDATAQFSGEIGRAGILSLLGQCLELEGNTSGAIEYYRQALRHHPSPHPSRHETLDLLAGSLIHRRENGDGDEAVLLCREILELRPVGHALRAQAVTNFAIVLAVQLEDGQLDMDEARVTCREALALHPRPDPVRAQILPLFAATMTDQFRTTKSIPDLDLAIDAYRELTDTIPNPPFQLLLSFGLSLQRRFTSSSSNHADLQHAISLYRRVLDKVPGEPPVEVLNALSSCLMMMGDPASVDEAVKWQRTLHIGVNDGGDDGMHAIVPIYTHSLALALLVRFKTSHSLGDVDEALSILTSALRTAHGDDQLEGFRLAGEAHELRFMRSREFSDIELSTSYHRELVKLQGSLQNPRLAMAHNELGALHKLANSLTKKFDYTRQSDDIDEAISIYRRLLALDYRKRTVVVDALSTALLFRFEQSRELSDLNESINLAESSSGHTPTQLSTTLRMRYMVTRNPEDLESSLKYARRVLAEGAFDSLQVRANKLSLFSEALIMSSTLNPPHSVRSRSDIEEAITALRDAMDLLTRDEDAYWLIAYTLGYTFLMRYVALHDDDDLAEANRLYELVIGSPDAPALRRFQAAGSYATSADYFGFPSLKRYRDAIELLPQISALGLDVNSRHGVLTYLSTMHTEKSLACAAATCAIGLGEVEEAVELLEHGRAVFWAQALQLRSPLERLEAEHPDLGSTMSMLAECLENGPSSDVRRELHETWTNTVAKVRELDGFEDFLRPKKFHSLQQAAKRGPIVILNASVMGCQAIVLTSSEVRALKLDLDTAVLQSLTVLVASASTGGGTMDAISYLEKANIPIRRGERGGGPADFEGFSSDEIFELVLGKLWTHVARPVIEALHLTKSNEPGRLWWCPTGLFSLLPVHAAGLYNADSETTSLSDYALSSYVPTLESLTSSTPPKMDDVTMLVAIQSAAPDGYSRHMELPAARDELTRIERLVATSESADHGKVDLVALGKTPDRPSTVADVLGQITNASIVHLACHGMQDQMSPLKSAFILQDGKLEVTKLMQSSQGKGRLAFLSACETATIAKDGLVDEPIHLASTFLFAGFHGVVATMWSMSDNDGPRVADVFYEHLFQESSDTTKAVVALHEAISKLKEDKGCSFYRWVPFVHLGL